MSKHPKGVDSDIRGVCKRIAQDLANNYVLTPFERDCCKAVGIKQGLELFAKEWCRRDRTKEEMIKASITGVINETIVRKCLGFSNTVTVGDKPPYTCDILYKDFWKIEVKTSRVSTWPTFNYNHIKTLLNNINAVDIVIVLKENIPWLVLPAYSFHHILKKSQNPYDRYLCVKEDFSKRYMVYNTVYFVKS